MPANAIPTPTLADAVQAEADTDVRHELVDGELFAMAGGTPEHNQLAANLLADGALAQLRAGLSGVVRDFNVSDDRDPLIEQSGQHAEHLGLGLAAEPKEEHVVACEQCVGDLRDDGVVVASDPREEGAAGSQAGDEVFP